MGKSFTKRNFTLVHITILEIYRTFCLDLDKYELLEYEEKRNCKEYKSKHF